MTHISSIGAGVYSDLSISREVLSTIPTTEADFVKLFQKEVANGSAIVASAPLATISAITAATPPVITTAAHGFTVGSTVTVTFNTIVGTTGIALATPYACIATTATTLTMTPATLAGGGTFTSATANANSGEFTRIKNVREFPAMGTPANIVNVPVYGQKSSQQVQGQSDSPSMEVTVNYLASDWQDAANYLGYLVGDGNQYAFRFALLNSEPNSYESLTAGLGSTQNSEFYWVGKIEALMVNPQLTDANTATITFTIQSAMYGAWTI